MPSKRPRLTPYQQRQKRRRHRFALGGIVVLCAFAFFIGRCTAADRVSVDLVDTDPGASADPVSVSNGVKSGNELLTLVNAKHPVPSDWSVSPVQLKNQQSIDRRAYTALQRMLDDAREQGLDPLICSSYRTHGRQKELFAKQVNKFLSQGYSNEIAKEKAAEWVAVPGTSEHELGLAVDIVAMDHQALDETQEDTAEQRWLMANCWKYGFILRYPTDKHEITGIQYEPWHYRYVGEDAAKEIMQKGLCLEEYLDQV